MPVITVHQALQTALAFHQSGDLPAAEAICRKVLASAPTDADALHLLGMIALATGRNEEARQCLSSATLQAPANGVFLSDLGLAYRQLGRFEPAVLALQKAAALRPDLPAIQLNLGQALLSLGAVEKAIETFQRALEMAPDLAEAHYSLGAVFSKMGEREKAIAANRRALELNPGFAKAHNNLGAELTEQGRWDEAIASLRRAEALKPDLPGLQTNLAHAFLGKGEFAQAMDCYRQALARQPASARAHFDYGSLLLLLGRYEEGWPEYEWRWCDPEVFGIERPGSATRWHGEPAPNQTLLVHCEQGFGDALQFVRYLPLLRQQANPGRLILECPPELERLFRQAPALDAEIIVRLDAEDTKLPPADLHCPLLSLPLELRKMDPLQVSRPYLQADQASRARWRERLGSSPALRVGLVWAGNPRHPANPSRSFDPEMLGPILAVKGIQFYSLQFERKCPAQLLGDFGIIDLTAEITDFSDTAALIEELDLVISVDTSVAHLAGALGRPLWLLLSSVPDWRWELSREDSPWYPTMRLFRQWVARDWDSVIQRVADELRLFNPLAAGGSTKVHL